MNWANLAILLGPPVLVAFGLTLLQRHVPFQIRQRHNEVAGYIFAMVGVLYAVLLAFVVIVVWEATGDARATTFREADQLAGIYWNARQFPAPQGPQLERLVLQYAHTVIEDEWPLMAEHDIDPQATALMYRIRDAANDLRPADPAQQVQYESAVAHVEGVATERRARLVQIHDAVPPLLWGMLTLGAVLTIGFTFVFGVSNAWVHIAMVITMTVLISVSLIAVKEMNFPFDGRNAVRPTAFEVFLARLPPAR